MRNQVFGIFFYLLYLLAMVRPIIPIIEYHANYDYISSVLCENRDKPYLECNGKCYLEKQLKKTNNTHQDHKSTVPQISFEDYPLSPLDIFSYQTKEFQELNTAYFLLKNIDSQDFLTTILKPPQLLS
jgi:hypothetical protein